jgi:facilitated trehalose transporter
MYIAEISIPVMRGLFSSLPQLSLAFGILLVYCIGSVPEIGYFRTAFVGAIIGSILPCLSLIVPETPRYLISKGKRQKTMSVLKWLYGPNVDLSLELIELDKILYKQRKLSVREYCAELTRKNVFVPFIMLLFVMIFQQLCGINAIIFYGAPIFKEAGIIRSEFIALLAIGITEVLTTTASALIVDLFGRKLMLLLSSSVMTVSCIGLGIHLYFCHHDMHVYTSDTIPLAIVSVIMTIVGYSLGYGAIPWTLITELLPLNVRGSLGSVLAAVNWTVTAVVTGFYLSYADLLGPGVAWWSFAAVNALAVIFVALFLPETKGQQLETIQNQMTTKFKLCA